MSGRGEGQVRGAGAAGPRPATGARRPGRRLAAAGAALAVAATGAAGAASPAAPQVEARVVAPPSVAPEGRGTVVVEMTIGPGWHVNAHRPSESFLIPTNVALAPSEGKLSAIKYPEPVERKFEFSDKPLAVYEGTVRFEATLELPPGAAGTVTLDGVLSYQACNATQCFPPAKKALAAAVRVAEAPAAGK